MYIETKRKLMPRETWLSYNGAISIKVDRYKVARSSCHFFRQLLAGPYKEATQNYIEIRLGDMFSFEAFSCIIGYANDDIFIKDPDKIDLYIEAIQLAILWAYDEFVQIVETFLAEQISLDTITDIHGLAKRHKYVLVELEEACDSFERKLRTKHGQMVRAWPRCPIDGHEEHSYLDCHDVIAEDFEEDNCDDVISETDDLKLTDKQSEELARIREMINLGRFRRGYIITDGS